MKRVRYAICLLICCALASPARAIFVYNANTQILTDTQGARMWLLHRDWLRLQLPLSRTCQHLDQPPQCLARGGYSDWHLPTVPSGDPTPLALSGKLSQLFNDLSAAYPNRDDSPFGLGATAYGGNVIFADLYADGGRYWGMSFGNGGYQSLYCGFAYPYVGTIGHPVHLQACQVTSIRRRCRWLRLSDVATRAIATSSFVSLTCRLAEYLRSPE